MGYAELGVLGKTQGELTAMIPAALIGTLRRSSFRFSRADRPETREIQREWLAGQNRDDNSLLKEMTVAKPIDLKAMGCGMLLACCF